MERTTNATINMNLKEDNMTVLEYANEVAQQIRETTLFTAEAKEIVKNNGVTLTGILIGNGDRVSPIVYINQDYEDGKSIEDTAREVVQVYKSSTEKSAEFAGIMDLVEDFENAKEFVQPRLISKAANDVSNCPHKEFLDLYVIYDLRLSDKMTIKITNQMFDNWGVTLDGLDRIARENIRPVIMTMNKMLESLGFPILPGMEAPEDMFVITNESKLYGATSILSAEILDRFNKDMFIIPSSVHEMIVVPADDEMGLELGNIIKEINATEVKPEEVLGEEPYFFDYTTKEIRKVVA